MDPVQQESTPVYAGQELSGSDLFGQAQQVAPAAATTPLATVPPPVAAPPPVTPPPVAPQPAAPQPVAEPPLPQRLAADVPPTAPVITVRIMRPPTLTALPDLARVRRPAREPHPLFSKDD